MNHEEITMDFLILTGLFSFCFIFDFLPAVKQRNRASNIVYLGTLLFSGIVLILAVFVPNTPKITDVLNSLFKGFS